MPEDKASPAMARVINDAALAALEKIPADLTLIVEHRNAAQIKVRVNVAGAKTLEDQLGVRAFRAEGPEIDHHRNIRDRARLHRAIDGRPVGPAVVRGLDP